MILRTEENIRKISTIMIVIKAAEWFPAGAHDPVLNLLELD